MEKNGTIVSFPLRNLDMRQYMTEAVRDAIPPVASLASMSNSALKAVAAAVLRDHGANLPTTALAPIPPLADLPVLQ